MAELLFEVSMFQNHTKLRSKCSTSLVSSFNLTLTGWWGSLLAERRLCLGDHRFSFTRTACICYHATQIHSIFLILQLSLLTY